MAGFLLVYPTMSYWMAFEPLMGQTLIDLWLEADPAYLRLFSLLVEANCTRSAATRAVLWRATSPSSR